MPIGGCLVWTRFLVTVLERVLQRLQAAAQRPGAVGDRMDRAVGVVRARPDAAREVSGVIAHLLEPVADHGPRVVGTKRGVPFQGIQQLLLDPVVVRMAPGAQAGLVQGLGPPVNLTEQSTPIPTPQTLLQPTTPLPSAAVERPCNQGAIS